MALNPPTNGDGASLFDWREVCARLWLSPGVYITPTEASAAALNAAGHCATTAIGGLRNWRAEHAQVVATARPDEVWIVVDPGAWNDREARAVWQTSRAAGCRGVQLVELTATGHTVVSETSAAPSDADADPPSALDVCLDTFGHWLYLDDLDPVLFALGVIAGNLLEGDPVWGLVVGAPSSGKTEVVSALSSLDYVHAAATMTEASLLSGTAGKEREKGATGGLLCQIGDFGVVLCKDFGSVLNMERSDRARAMAALREIYDGSWSRPVGAGGGKVLRWTGKCGLIGAVPPGIDRHHAVMGALGERFMLYRLSVEDPHAQARRRLANRGRERAMRVDLGRAIAPVLDGIQGTAARPLSGDEVTRLIDLAVFVVRARTAVERDSHTREVEVMPEAEAPGRLIGSLDQLRAGVEAIGATTATAWHIVTRVAWGCVSPVRLRLLERLRALDGPAASSDLTSATGIPKPTADRALEDLALLHLVERTKTATHDTAAWAYRLSEEATVTWPNGSPGM